MGVIFLILAGAMLGWLGSIIARAEQRQAVLMYVAGGAGGALITGLFVSPMLGRGDMAAGLHTAATLLISLSGAIVAVVAVNLFRRQQVRAIGFSEAAGDPPASESR